ncbi:MAG: SRPBCC family protein [Chloroflexota bacterium]|nr:SRPBCC family protein [Chloroflexota bacterium]
MSTIELSIVIDRPIEVVFDNATCLRGCVNWQTAIQSAEKLSSEPTQVGTRFRHVVKFMGMSAETHPMVTTYNAPREFAYRDPESRIRFETRLLFDETPEGTRFTINLTGSIDQSLLGKLAQPLLQRSMLRQFERDMETLKDLLENDVVVQVN